MADAGRAAVGHRPAESQLEAEGDEGFRLLPAAVEGVGNAAADGDTAQMPDDLIDGPPHMQDDRQVVLAGQFELGGEKALLARQIEFGKVAVETDFPTATGRSRWSQSSSTSTSSSCASRTYSG